tara:strand:- start:5173 stop:5334 length:162 start_codon:yes stop_codon:yes gene_type:complete
MDEKVEKVELTEAQQKARRSRSIALGVVLAALAVLFYVITVAKLGPNLFNRPM